MTINDEIAYALLAYRADEWSLAEALSRIRDTLHSAPEPAKPTPAKSDSDRKNGTAAGKKAAPSRPDKAEVVAWAAANGAGYKRTARAWSLPESTVRDWLNK